MTEKVWIIEDFNEPRADEAAMIDYEVVWDGTPRHYGGYLGCAPEAPAPALVVGPECARQRARVAGTMRMPRSSTTWNHAGVVARLDAALTSDPATIKELAARIGWCDKTVNDALYWHGKAYPGRVQRQLSNRGPRLGRRVNEYWVAS